MPETQVSSKQQAIPFSEYAARISSVHDEVLRTGLLSYSQQQGAPALLKSRVADFLSWLKNNSESLTFELKKDARLNLAVTVNSDVQSQVVLGVWLSGKYLLYKQGATAKYRPDITSKDDGGSPFFTIQGSVTTSIESGKSRLSAKISTPPEIVLQWAAIEREAAGHPAKPFLVGLSAMHEFVHVLPYMVNGTAGYLSEVATALVARKYAFPQKLEGGSHHSLHGVRDPLVTMREFGNKKSSSAQKNTYYAEEYLATWAAVWIDAYCQKNAQPLDLLSMVSPKKETATMQNTYDDIKGVWAKNSGKFGPGELEASAAVRAREFCRDSAIPQFEGKFKEVFKQLLQTEFNNIEDFTRAFIRNMDVTFGVTPAPSDLPPGWSSLIEGRRSAQFADLSGTIPKKPGGRA